jgi:hypothetical protein
MASVLLFDIIGRPNDRTDEPLAHQRGDIYKGACLCAVAPGENP